jgi:ferrous iron transport protein A
VSSPKQISLSELPVDEYATVLSFSSGRLETSRLASLGFTPGVEVNMSQNYGRGPLIVSVRGTRVALGRGEAAKILVAQTEE